MHQIDIIVFAVKRDKFMVGPDKIGPPEREREKERAYMVKVGHPSIPTDTYGIATFILFKACMERLMNISHEM